MKVSAKYTLEFLVIVTGIMASFLIEEFRQTAKENDKEKNILREIEVDLGIDSNFISYIVKQIEIASEFANSLLRSSEDSIKIKLDAVLSYHNIKTRDIGFKKLSAGDNYNLIKDENLFRAITIHYSQNYELLDEWARITRQLVLDRILPFLEKNGVAESYNDKYLYGIKSVRKLKNNNEFRNLLRTSAFYKNSYHKICEAILKNNKYILEAIDKYLGEKSD